jgi:hypothetical protein
MSKELLDAANAVLVHFMPTFSDSRAVDDCLVQLAAAVAGVESHSHEMCEGASVRGAPGTSMETALEAFAVLTGGETRVGRQIRLIPALLIGELQVGAAVSETGHSYIALGPITGDEESAIEMDGIEAQALHEWLGKALEPQLRRGGPAPETAELLSIARDLSTMDCFWSASGHHEADCKCLSGRAERAIATHTQKALEGQS